MESRSHERTLVLYTQSVDIRVLLSTKITMSVGWPLLMKVAMLGMEGLHSQQVTERILSTKAKAACTFVDISVSLEQKEFYP